MDLPAAQIDEAWSLIAAAHPDSTICVKVGMWRHVFSDTSRRSLMTIDVSVFEPGSSDQHQTLSFPDVDSLLQWAKDGANIAEVADADT